MEQEFINKYIGEKIRHKRKCMGMTQTDLGDFLGVSTQQISKYEKGIDHINLVNLYRLSRALKTRVNSFLDGMQSSLDNKKKLENINFVKLERYEEKNH